MIHRICFVSIALLMLASPFTEAAQRKRQPKAAVSARTLALYELGEYKGVKYRLMKPIDFDPTKDITQYASDRVDKTPDIWDWLFKQNLSKRK